MPAAGKSSRFRDKEKKPFATLEGRAVWLRAAELFVTRPDVKQVFIVIAPEDLEKFKLRFAANIMFLNVQVVEGGAERFESVANALAKLAPEVNFVAVHDAVRPCTPSPVVDAVFQAAEKSGAALSGAPVSDTLKRVNNAMEVTATLSRSGLWLAQTPQVFRRDWLEEAYRRRGEVKGPVTDDAQLVEPIGHRVRIIPASIENIKITSSADVEMAERFLTSRKTEKVTPRGPLDDYLIRCPQPAGIVAAITPRNCCCSSSGQARSISPSNERRISPNPVRRMFAPTAKAITGSTHSRPLKEPIPSPTTTPTDVHTSVMRCWPSASN